MTRKLQRPSMKSAKHKRSVCRLRWRPEWLQRMPRGRRRSVWGNKSNWLRRPGHEPMRKLGHARRRRGLLWSRISMRRGDLPKGRPHGDDYFYHHRNLLEVWRKRRRW